MKTKGEIIRKHEDGAYAQVNDSYFLDTSHMINIEKVLEMMTEYAKEVQQEQIRVCAVWAASFETGERGYSEHHINKMFKHFKKVVKINV